MDWLFYNTLADIYGPPFLLVYGVMAAATVAVAYGMVRAYDKTGLREPPLVPETLDPYEIAYLRGGKYAVILTVLYALQQRGRVTVVTAQGAKLSRPLADADLRGAKALTALEECVLRWIDGPVEPSSVFTSNKLGSDVEKVCEPYRRTLESGELLRTVAVRNAAMRITLAASAVLVALAVCGIMIAAAGERPFVELAIVMMPLMTICSLFLLWFLVVPMATARISERGKAYIKRLRMAYSKTPQPPARRSGTAPQPGPSVAMIGLFGLGILSTTPDAAFASLFARNVGRCRSCASIF